MEDGLRVFYTPRDAYLEFTITCTHAPCSPNGAGHNDEDVFDGTQTFQQVRACVAGLSNDNTPPRGPAWVQLPLLGATVMQVGLSRFHSHYLAASLALSGTLWAALQRQQGVCMHISGRLE